MKIKICGVNDRENLRQLLELAPDYIGLNFYSSSKRFCTWTQLPALNYENTKLVGVFVNSELIEITEKIKTFNLSVVQLHGTEEIDQATQLRQQFSKIEIVKAIGVESAKDLLDVDSWSSSVDYCLFDKKATSFGGTGVKFSWDLLHTNPPQKDFFLAGGIGAEDLRAIMALEREIPKLYAIDINSRFEKSEGLKDIVLVKKFIEDLRK